MLFIVDVFSLPGSHFQLPLSYLRYIVPDVRGVKCRDVIDDGLEKDLGEAFSGLAEGVKYIIKFALSLVAPSFPAIGIVMNYPLAVDILELSDMAIHPWRRDFSYDIAVVDESIGIHMEIFFEVLISNARRTVGV
jgi:hypothetical protein